MSKYGFFSGPYFPAFRLNTLHALVAVELKLLSIMLDKYLIPPLKENFREYLRALTNIITKNVLNRIATITLSNNMITLSNHLSS